ncbi:hypothetical protein [Lysobacter gummosus]|uniref:hypothetical protein n=1 Tax=Lysobacter gummosus TaxID=262324 RepID=UPI0036300104
MRPQPSFRSTQEAGTVRSTACRCLPARAGATRAEPPRRSVAAAQTVPGYATPQCSASLPGTQYVTAVTFITKTW